MSLAAFTVKKDLDIVDFSKDVNLKKWNELYKQYQFMPTRMMTYIMASFQQPTSDNVNYLATQYISDRIRKCGFDGIAYRSYFSTKRNYAIFNCCDSNVDFIHSHLMLVENRGYRISSLSGYQKIEGEPIKPNMVSIKKSIRDSIEDRKRVMNAKA